MVFEVAFFFAKGEALAKTELGRRIRGVFVFTDAIF
jgi:hypothetical protein